MSKIIGLCRWLFGAAVITALAADATMAAIIPSYGYRWTIAELPRATVAPPWKLLWDRSPIWFERWRAAGLSESPSRRIVRHNDTLLMVARRTLYFLDKGDGTTVASIPLAGDEIFDWVITDGLFVYASGDHDSRAPILGAIDLSKRQALWTRKQQRRIVHPGWLIALDEKTVVSGADDDIPGTRDELVALDARTGTLKWAASKGLAFGTLVFRTWFARNEYLSTFVAPEGGGLHIKRFRSIDGRPLPLVHIFGTEKVGNLFTPYAVTTDGILYLGYGGSSRDSILGLVAFDLDELRLLWHVSLPAKETSRDPRLLHCKSVSTGPGADPVVVTIWPDTVMLIDRIAGTIIRSATISPYVGWTEPNALLYSYPYLFTSARRVVDQGMAYDLIAINMETMRIDWSHELSRQRERFLTARSEILDFVADADTVYVARADARIMAFRISPRRE